MIGRVTRLHCDKSAVTGGAKPVASKQFRLNRCAACRRLRYGCPQQYRLVCRRWPFKCNRVIRCYRAWWMIRSGALHQVPGCSPVAVTIHQCADDAAAQNAGKRFVMCLRSPFRRDHIAVNKTANAQALLVCWSATKTRVVWRIDFLQTFFTHLFLLVADRFRQACNERCHRRSIPTYEWGTTQSLRVALAHRPVCR